MIGIGKTLTRKNSIIVTFSIIILLYSFFIGQLLWGLIAVLQISILWALIYLISKKIK